MTFAARVCRECGKPFQARHRSSLFDSVACKQRWNNRRQQRGAELYDFVMADLHDPLIRQLVIAYKRADRELRGGRPSSQDIDVAAMRLPRAYGNSGDGR